MNKIVSCYSFFRNSILREFEPLKKFVRYSVLYYKVTRLEPGNAFRFTPNFNVATKIKQVTLLLLIQTNLSWTSVPQKEIRRKILTERCISEYIKLPKLNLVECSFIIFYYPDIFSP